jgi:gas vesicle protein
MQEYTHMNTMMQERRDYGFAIGLLTGTFVGAGLMMWLAPRMMSELRQQATDSAKRVSTRVVTAVDDLTRKGQGVRDDVADVVARSAHEVERLAVAAKTAVPHAPARNS